MKPFHLHILLIPESGQVKFQWFGQSAIHVKGSLDLPRRSPSETALIPEDFQIDLNPLMADIATNTITDQDDFQQADEFLILRDLFRDQDFAEFCETLYHFLWREAQTAPPEAIRSIDQAWIDPDQRLVRVWFATNRKPINLAGEIQFDPRESVEEITYGLCNVFIPKSHKPGSIGVPWWLRWIRFEADDTLKVKATFTLPHNVFWAGFADTLAQWWNPGERNVFVLIHGFNVDFVEAAIRAAQIGYDLKLPGEIAFYSWPSRGDMTAYSADEATITASVAQIAQFLHEITEKSGAERIHLFVHSMGNRGFLSALERLVADDHTLSLGQVFFCAPDEDVRTFKDKTTLFPHQFENRTLLVSPDDKAVAGSRWKHRYDRVGFVPPMRTFPDMDTITVSGFGILDLGHGYYASAEPVILDMREAIATKRTAGERSIPKPVGDHFEILL